MENKYKNALDSKKKKNAFADKNSNKQTRSRVLSLAQLLSRVRKQRGFSGLAQGNSRDNIQSTKGTTFSTQTRNSQFSTNQKGIGSFGNSNFANDNKGKTRFYGETNLNGQMTKSQTRLEIQKEEQKRQKPIKPIIPPKSLVIILREKPEKILYNRRIIDYKHCGLLQRYIGLGGKILPRRQTRLTAKQQRYIAKTIKSARIMGLLPFVSKEKSFFR